MPDVAAKSAPHVVAVIGGATAGAEVASRLAARGAVVVVFEQNPRPYGKIEDGLPRWHVALRNKEYGVIGGKLSKPGVHYVPNTKVGDFASFSDLANEWGFQAVVLACGAWRDRPLPIDGSDAYVGKGIIYQNPFVIGFNHSEEPDFGGEVFEYRDGAIVVGGGLASIDVAKILMLETARAKLAERGIEVTNHELEVKGIPKLLAGHDLTYDDLGLEGCTIYYRRRILDMPLVEAPEGATPERLEKVRNSRKKVLDKAMDKYRFKIEPLSAPDGILVEDGRVVGMRFRRTRIEDGRVVATDDTYERRGSYVVSSIGSIPEPIPGIDMKGELLAFTDWDVGKLEAYPTVFSVGNVVTGKGNIVASRKHATKVSADAIERFLGLGEEGHDGDEAIADAATQAAAETADRVAEQLAGAEPASSETLEAILRRVRERQEAVGYPGDFKAWIERVTPAPA